jgi:hypothetical protein
MELIHLSTTKTEFGLYLILVLINGRKYEYRIPSYPALEKFEYFLKKGWVGKALNMLKKFNS